MKAIMISIKPQHLVNILNGKKTIEIRKNKSLTDAVYKLIIKQGYADIYVYCSKDAKNLLHKNCANIYWVEDKDFQSKNKKLGLETQPYLNGKVVCCFKCYSTDIIYWTFTHEHPVGLTKESCLSKEEILKYLNNKVGYALHISYLKIFDTPKELSEFKVYKDVKAFSDLSWLEEGQKLRFGTLNKLSKAPQNFAYVEIPNDN